jgi:hypothetical protein
LYMKKTILFTTCLFLTVLAYAQTKKQAKFNRYADLALTIGDSRGTTAFSYIYSRNPGKKQKWEIGLGARFTSNFGTKQEYYTAPAKLARTNTIPFLIVFAGQNTANWDTLNVQRPLVNSFNISANFGYRFSPKWSAGFNIDLLGFSFGRKSPAVLTSNGLTKTEPAAKVIPFNILLTGDLDRGSLNSEFFAKYMLNKKWGVRGVYQFIFSEYKTTTAKQVAPDGTIVDRFRNKANNFGLALSYHF